MQALLHASGTRGAECARAKLIPSHDTDDMATGGGTPARNVCAEHGPRASRTARPNQIPSVSIGHVYSPKHSGPGLSRPPIYPAVVHLCVSCPVGAAKPPPDAPSRFSLIRWCGDDGMKTRLPLARPRVSGTQAAHLTRHYR
ncbi:hypothetical protein C8Q76DRAFT_704303 [Earliella scabrosa]|nr:hypothetical protein C8Q76DRAFT_704303 [Earliella scabrosa]